ncbi:hypothetical protein ACFWIO_14020 [Streptomyces diastatochromogenes]|uniref:hypothetical protein n=1 Tax=Streptomyces diastatochromogenes TaxID=42236 RepID=UPI003650133B
MHHRTGQDVLRDVVRHVAPAELEKLDETCRVYLVRPHPPQRLHRPAGDPLGIGFESDVVLPVLVAVVAQVLADLASGRIRAGGSRLKRWWRRRRGTDTEGRRAALTSAVPELSEVTRQELADWTIAQGRAAGLSAPQAETCAQVIVVAVVRGNAAPQPVPDAPAEPEHPTETGHRAETGHRPEPEHRLEPEPEHRPEPEPEQRAAPDPRTAAAGPGDDTGAGLRSPESGDAPAATHPSPS